MELLKKGIPVEVAMNSPCFNYNHHELLNNLRRGYELKENQIMEIYEKYGVDIEEQIVGDTYSGVSHAVTGLEVQASDGSTLYTGEYYPMTEEEEKSKFKQLETYRNDITKLKNRCTFEAKVNVNRAEKNIKKFGEKYPEINDILAFLSDYDELLAICLWKRKKNMIFIMKSIMSMLMS